MAVASQWFVTGVCPSTEQMPSGFLGCHGAEGVGLVAPWLLENKAQSSMAAFTASDNLPRQRAEGPLGGDNTENMPQGGADST